MNSSVRCLLLVLLSACVLSADVVDVVAQPGRGDGGGRRRGGGGFGGGGGALELLRREDVQKEIGLSADQTQKLTDFQEGMRSSPEFQEIFGRMRSASAEERTAIFQEMRTLMDKKVGEIVSTDQRKRLDELSIQRQGTRALASGEVAKSLNLTEAQGEKIDKAVEEYDTARREIRFNRDVSDEERDAQTEKLREKRDATINGVLTAQQKQQFQARQGKTFEFAQDQGRGFGGPRGPQTTGAPQPGAAPTTVRPAATYVAEEAPDDAEATVSFGAGKTESDGPVQKMSFSFRYAPWEDVLKMYAKAADLTLDIYNLPPGTFNYFDSGEYNPTEALDIINGYLIQKGYIIVRRDKFLVVVNIDSGIPPNLVPTVSLAEMQNRGRNELMRIILPLEAGMTSDDAATEVQELLGPQGKVVPQSKLNRLIITDIGTNLRQIHSLLTGLNLEDGDKIFRQFKLTSINVLDAETIVRDLFGLGPRGVQNVSAGATGGSTRGSSQDPRSRFGSSTRFGSPQPQQQPRNTTTASSSDQNAEVKVAVDERTNSLLVTASPANIKIVEEAIESIDIPAEEGAFDRRNREPSLEVYQLTSADPIEVTKTLNVLYPGAVVNEDGRARRIHIFGDEETHREIASLIRRLDGEGGGGTQVAVIPLGRLDSYTATASIQQLFLLDGDQAPVIQPQPTGNGLIVRGSVAQVEQIKILLAELDPADGRGSGQNGNIRQIPLGGRDPEVFLQALEQMWRASERNPIRRVVPSSTGAIRGRVIPSLPDQPLLEPATGPRPAARPSESTPVRGGADLEPARNAFDRLIGRIENEQATTQLADFLDDELSLAADELEELNDGPVAAPQVESPQGVQPEPAAEAEPAVQPKATDEDLEALKALDAFLDEEDAAKENKPAAPKIDPDTPIAITISGGNIVAVSNDTEALNRLEDAASSLSQAMPPKTQWTVFYLQSAEASETATILERIFPTSSVSSGTTTTSGFLGDLSSGLSSMGRGLVNMSGLDSIMTGPQTLRIIPDVRSNSLFVTGPPHQIDEVEDVLRILDASELPEQLSARAPRYIDVLHAYVGDVAEMVNEVYKEELTPPAPQQNNRGQNPLAAMMGGGGGSSGKAPRVKMTLGVDYQTSRLIISCSEPLFNQVQQMVDEIDKSALASRKTIRVVSLEHANSQILQQTLGALMPRVKVSSSTTGGGTSGSGGGNNNSNQGGGSQPSADQMRQQFIQQAMERARQGGGRGGQPGAASSRGPGGGSRGPGGGSRGPGGGGRGFGGGR